MSLAHILGEDTVKVRHTFSREAELLKRGGITERTFWENIENLFDASIPETLRSKIWTPIELFQPDQVIMDYILSLKSKNYVVSVLSNTFPATAFGIKQRGWYDHFNVVVLSSDVGFAKPDLEIYELILAKTHLSASETLFIDDQEKCLKPARTLGMGTVLSLNSSQMIAEIEMALK